MEFSERLKELRLKAKLTQTEVAEKVGVSQPQYARWEAGKRKPTSETLQKFADFFGVSMDYLAGNEPEEDELANVELLFRMTSDGLTEEEKAVFREELIEFMKERKKLFEEDEKAKK
ncbi:putative transcriptional regulator [Streptococcus infantarius subsp. infantarius]|nr:putative transcriptional regulator [Streptococcus infantarius subsp. infantarius]